MKKETKDKLERALVHFILSAILLIIVFAMQDKVDTNLFLFIIITLTLLVGYLLAKLWGSQIIVFVRKNTWRLIAVLFLVVIGLIIYFL
jgi:hypothetical protein